MIFSNRTYDILKYIALICLPALAAAYVGLCKIWGFPYGEEVAGTISVIVTLFGTLLQISANKYSKMLATVETDVGEDNSKG